jgi:dihydroorotate dehydrogenase (fumarate)/dihydroorotate dehydrogenase
LADQRAIVVNYGLPNDGADAVARRLAARRKRIPIGANIVKTNDGPEAAPASDEQILADYCYSIATLAPLADYLTLNLSCPNAAGGKDFFAEADNIGRLLERLVPLRIRCPVFLKVSPNDEAQTLRRMVAAVEPFPFVRGFLFNLPPGKPPTLQWSDPIGDLDAMPGAVSGAPVRSLVDRCIATLATLIDPQRHRIIGVGGIFSAEDAYRKIRLGASALQLYTALVYEGPGVVRRINRSLVDLLHRDGFTHISQAVGVDAGSLKA